nr:DUF1294 domain-containing protein [Sinorhizobium fredii]
MILTVLTSINLATYCLFWLDKRAAQRNAWRVSERMLLTFAAIGGSLGALLACPNSSAQDKERAVPDFASRHRHVPSRPHYRHCRYESGIVRAS